MTPHATGPQTAAIIVTGPAEDVSAVVSTFVRRFVNSMTRHEPKPDEDAIHDAALATAEMAVALCGGHDPLSIDLTHHAGELTVTIPDAAGWDLTDDETRSLVGALAISGPDLVGGSLECAFITATTAPRPGAGH